MAGKVKRRNGKSTAEELLLPFPAEESDDCPALLPAAGYRNGTSVNNSGTNGNYWSSSLNESNSNNAYKLNFNSSNQNTNNNNRYNGRSVRPVTELTGTTQQPASSYTLTREQLLTDLYRAYKDARRHKRRRDYQLRFEMDLEDNLVKLCDELYSRSYVPAPSTCFIITSPKKREVFAADFRDRVVHHLYYNYVAPMFERMFVYDSYSCRKGKGTHLGISRLERYIRKASHDYKSVCYIMKLDIEGYFMHIDRSRLLDICMDGIRKMGNRRSDDGEKRWKDRIDLGFVQYLSEVIIQNDPTENCIIKGRTTDWKNLPKSKSLFHSPPGCGLPIGNLTSQLFSNVYLNVLDNYMKRVLHKKFYGRYVDDFYIVAESKKQLRHVIPCVSEFLTDKLGLKLHPAKTILCDCHKGISFVGTYLKPFRKYINNRTLKRMRNNVETLRRHTMLSDRNEAQINSWLGVLSHSSSYNIRLGLFCSSPFFFKYGYFGNRILTYKIKKVKQA